MYFYHFHGISVRSGISLELPLLGVSGDNPAASLKHLEIVVTQESPRPSGDPLWCDPYHYTDGSPVARLFKNGDCYIMEATFTGFFSFEEERITVFLEGEDPAPVPYILGRVFAFWMELNGFPLLHGSCFQASHGAVGLLGDSGMGKSTLSAALVAHGRKLLTDDLIPLWLEDGEAIIYPGIPMSRIWPDTGNQLVPDFEKAERIHHLVEKRKIFDDGRGGPRFATNTAPLRDLYVLERSLEHSEISTRVLPPAAALMELVRLSYRPELVQIIGFQPRRLRIMAEVLKKVRVHKLVYPSGFQHLEAICRRISQAPQESDS